MGRRIVVRGKKKKTKKREANSCKQVAAADFLGCTALHYAAHKGYTEVVLELLKSQPGAELVEARAYIYIYIKQARPVLLHTAPTTSHRPQLTAGPPCAGG